MTHGQRLAGRCAVITGAGSGIGQAVAQLFAAEGAAIVCLDRVREAAEKVAQSIAATGAKARALAADVSVPEEVAAACERIGRECGSVDVLVNNAGGGGAGAGAVGQVEIEHWRRSVDLNLGAAFYMARALWPLLARRRGAIVNNGSIMGLRGDVGSVAYCAAKSALVGLTRSLAADGAELGIRVNCVCPGFVDTPAMRAEAQDPASGRGMEDFARRIPLGRMATTREVAYAFLFLASDEAAYVTGSTLVVDGGATLGYLGSDLAHRAGGYSGAAP